MPVERHKAAIGLLLALLIHQAHGQSKQLQLTKLDDLTLSNANTGSSLDGRANENWQIRPEVLGEQACTGPDRWLVLELFANSTIPANQDGLPLLFMAAKGTVPTVDFSAQDGSLVFNPAPHGLATDSGNQGTFFDQDAFIYGRTYHRLLIPSISASDFWYVSVKNMAARSPLTSYAIRASCAQRDSVPCPRPLPGKGECSNTPGQEDRGTCVAVAGSLTGNTTKQCVCKSATFDSRMWGNFACDVALKQFSSSGQQSAVEVSPRGWTWFHVTVPGNSMEVKNQMLLVELRRSPESARGSRPVLFLKPVNTLDRNVPTVSDYRLFADTVSSRSDQSFHYRMTRDFATQDPVQWYIGVWNNNADMGPLAVPPIVRATVTVKWGTATTPFSCPNDCYGRGQCKDPRMSDSPFSRAAPFTCACNPGFGGLTCDGTSTTVRVDPRGDLVTGLLNPGDWSYTRLDIDPRRFDFRSDSVSFKWRVTDSQNAPGNSLINARLQLSPVADALGNINVNDIVDQTTFADLAAADKDALNVPGSFLLPGASYVLALHNVEVYRLSPFRYELEIFVPSPVSAWLHPYLSVVLGITAAIVLCLLMTLCKRIIMQRHLAAQGQQASPLQMFRADGTPIGVLTQVAPRQQGVPQHIIDTFPKYQYVAPSDAADKKVARSVSKVSRAEREATQAAAAEAAVTAAAARMAASQQQQNGSGGDVEMSTVVNKQATSELPAPERATPEVPVSHAVTAASWDEGPTCSICLCEYEPGDNMRRLPCGHEFHLACIDQWMKQSCQCAICREPLVPDEASSSRQPSQQTGISVIFIPQGLSAGSRSSQSQSRSPWQWAQRYRQAQQAGAAPAAASERSQRQGQPVAEYSQQGSQQGGTAWTGWAAGSATLSGQPSDSPRAAGTGAQPALAMPQGSARLSTRPSASPASASPLTPRRSQVAPVNAASIPPVT